MPLCVIDSVYSIGVRYQQVKNVIQRFCTFYNLSAFSKNRTTQPPIAEQYSTSKILLLLEQKNSKELAEKVFGNECRTSPRNGILKADAVVQFLNVLKHFNAEHLQDISALVNNIDFENSIRLIPGQRSGISLKYFFMLAGSDDLIKPDRMIIRFLHGITGKVLNANECQHVLNAVTNELNLQGYALTPKLLDHAIWNYQRSR